jgi:Peptidase family M23
MTSHRTTARGLALILALGLAAAASAAQAGKVPRQIVFPIVGPAQYFAGDFASPRRQGPHQGDDIMSVRHAPAVAAEAGRVEFETGNSHAGCMLQLFGRSGTEYVYIHLNNDLTAGNDNHGSCVQGVAFAKGLRSGDRVAAGQLVGYVGDSGDADGLQPHLHFEVHPSGRAAVDPYPTLQAAQRLLFSVAEGATFTLQLTGTMTGGDPTAKSVKVKVDSARWWPNGLRVDGVNRTVKIDTSIASVDSAADSAARVAKVGQRRMTIMTAPMPATRDAQFGKPDALVAQRVLLGQ